MELNEFLNYLNRHRSTKKWAAVFSEAVAADQAKGAVPSHVTRAR